MGGKGVLHAGHNHPSVETGVPCDAGHQQLGIDSAHTFASKLGGRLGLTRPGNLPHAPSNITICEYAQGPCMSSTGGPQHGASARVRTIYRTSSWAGVPFFWDVPRA